jgi:transcriptional regulator with XRE-family HTH domain
MDITTELGIRIKNLRETVKLTQAQLAEASGLSDNFIGLVERGRAIPSVKSLSKIAEALGVSLAELFRFPDSGEELSPSEKLIRELSWLLKDKPPEDIQLIVDISRRILERLPG